MPIKRFVCEINGVEYKSANEAERYLGICHSTIIHRMNSSRFPNYRLKERIKMVGVNSPRWGVSPSLELRERISKKLKGRSRPPDFCKKMSERMTGDKHPSYNKVCSDEARERLSRIHKGYKPSKEAIQKQKDSRGGRYLAPCVVDGIEYESIASVSRALNMARNKVTHRINSRGFPNYYKVKETL